MRTRTVFALAALTATLAMALAVTSASANRLSVTNPKFRITWTALSFIDGEPEPDPSPIRCAATLEGSFHSATIRKVLGALIGYVTKAMVKTETCAGGTARFLSERLPWHVTYRGFSGTLPAITRIRVLMARTAYESVFEGIACLFEGNATESLSGEFIREAGSAINTFEFDHSTRIPRVAGGFFCPTRAGLEGLGQVFLLGNTSRISVTLI